jgi:uncharacterized RDD family membrane protein YckC
MDPFDEFEFKPLTDGLGFHKKKTQKQGLVTPTELPSAKPDLLKGQGLELIDETSVDPLRSPLPRKSKIAVPDLTEVGGSPTNAPTAVDEILKTLQKNRSFEFEKAKAKAKISAPQAEEFKATSWSFSAALLDSMLVIAASLLCMIILLVVTKADLIGNLSHPDSEGMIYIATLSLFAGVSFIYLLVNRLFMGQTPGEWAFDQRIGKPMELNSTVYAVQVLARSVLVIATGFIVLPLISAIFGRDIAGEITGARLYKKV